MAKKKETKDSKDKKKYEYRHELVGIAYILVSLIGILGSSKMGLVGGLISNFAMFLVGVMYNLFLATFIIIGCYLIVKRKYPDFFTLRLIGLYISIIGVLTFIHMEYIEKNNVDVAKIFESTIDNFMQGTKSVDLLDGGGIIGATISWLMASLFSVEGGKIVAIVLLFIGVLLFLNISIMGTYDNVSDNVKTKYQSQQDKKRQNKVTSNATKKINSKDNVVVSDPNSMIIDKESKQFKDPYVSPKVNNVTVEKPVVSSRIEEKTPTVETNKDSYDSEVSTPVVKVNHNDGYRVPGITILKNIDIPKDSVDKSEVKKNIEILERVLKDFDVDAKVVLVNVGPTVTQYELELKSGTKVSKIVNLNKEIALALACKDVRIQAPIPGKSTIGIELANKKTTPVGIREVLTKAPNVGSENYLTVALGKDIMGEAIYYNLDKAPHLLVAGSTGSGKSVCINGIIISILTRTRPDEVRLVMVDPKKVELSGYNGVPHLLTPVVTDPKKASLALRNIVNEMERRYDMFSNANVKNITSYNDYVKNQKEKNPESELKNLAYIVVIIDELADLMLVAAKEVEDSIMRITQMARAAGIHLIVATQRPSTDVITGVVKANIPSRLSFSVSSSIDSRTILDMTGAEKLLGKGDMLFFPTGESAPLRIQGCYVSEEEIKSVVDYVCAEQQAEYDESLISEGSSGNGTPSDHYDSTDEKYDDPLYNEIVDFAISTGKISASLIQRKYRLGYNRAARIIDLLEDRGVIGGANGSKPREVLVKDFEEE